MAVCLSRVIFLYNVFMHFLLSSGNLLYLIDDKNHHSSSKNFPNITRLKPNELIVIKEGSTFLIYCYESVPKSLIHIWRTVHLSFEQVPLSYELFSGENGTEVHIKYSQKSFWHPSFWIGQSTVVDFPAFSQYCVGISTNEKYAVQLRVRTVNYWRLLQTLFGVLLFICAPTLSRNSFFHYASGVSLGTVASILILIYVISRFVPKKRASYAVLIFGYSFILYILQIFWYNLNEIFKNHSDIILAYCLLTAFISFIVCYRLGPVRNIKTFNIIQWCMQAIAVLLIFFSSEYREVSTSVILILTCFRLIPMSWITRFQFIWYYYFPPKVKLLTEVEYIEQGHIETKKALDNLKQYCSSPDCPVWKVVSRLKDPVRFANFIENGNHYTDQELLEYNSEDFSYVADSDTDADDNEFLSENIRNSRYSS